MLSLPIECAYMRAHTLGSERGERIKELGALGSLGSLEALGSLESLENLENLPRGRIETIEEMQNAKPTTNREHRASLLALCRGAKEEKPTK